MGHRMRRGIVQDMGGELSRFWEKKPGCYWGELDEEGATSSRQHCKLSFGLALHDAQCSPAAARFCSKLQRNSGRPIAAHFRLWQTHDNWGVPSSRRPSVASPHCWLLALPQRLGGGGCEGCGCGCGCGS
jgi:hypothetical protein